MIRLCVFLSFIFSINARPGIDDADRLDSNVCCLDHRHKETNSNSLDSLNFNCMDLTPFGKERCESVYSGGICDWKVGPKCHNYISKKCNRISYYTSHNGIKIDTGLCSGLCPNDNKCEPSLFSYLGIDPDGQISEIPEDMISNVPTNVILVKQIKDCDCSTCSVVPHNQVIEIPVGRCEGKCDDLEDSKICSSGIEDSFDLSNGPEPSNPSTSLLTNLLSTCSAGIQPGYDTFVNDRCFGHTFTDCLIKHICPLKQADLKICLEAASVPLTSTDSLILGINGMGIWSKRLTDLNGGSWNPGDNMCLLLDLNNLPIDGASIINDIQMVGHLDVVVQDDTAVDFLRLKIQYEQCQRCIPTSTTIDSLHQGNSITDFTTINDCDCINFSECHREELFETHFQGTQFETVVDVGQCLGRCNKFSRCSPREYTVGKIDGPHGSKEIKKIYSCNCSNIEWNGNGNLIKD
jgi:hypothetical protein